MARPKFKTTCLNLLVQRYSLNFSLDLNKELEANSDFQLFVNMDESMLQMKTEHFLFTSMVSLSLKLTLTITTCQYWHVIDSKLACVINCLLF
jgi:hypothetical protein